MGYVRKGYWQKQIDLDTFVDVWQQLVDKKITQTKAAEMLGVSSPTFRSWMDEVIVKYATVGNGDGTVCYDQLSFIKKEEE